jgi:hypothetical protein
MSQVMCGDSGVALQLFADIAREVVQPLLPIAPAPAIVFLGTQCQASSRDALVQTLGSWSISASQASSSRSLEELSEESRGDRSLHKAFSGIAQERVYLLRKRCDHNILIEDLCEEIKNIEGPGEAGGQPIASLESERGCQV